MAPRLASVVEVGVTANDLFEVGRTFAAHAIALAALGLLLDVLELLLEGER